jgi:hypothetical protein
MSASFSRILGVGLDVTEGGEQSAEFRIGSAAQADCVVRSLARGQQVEAVAG